MFNQSPVINLKDLKKEDDEFAMLMNRFVDEPMIFFSHMCIQKFIGNQKYKKGKLVPIRNYL